MGKVIALVSGKGGTGKTTSVAAISTCLAVLGSKTLCIDFDAGLKNLDLSLCMADFAVYDYMDVINGRMNLMEACTESALIPDMFFLSAPTTLDEAEPDSGAFKSMFAEIREEFDYCLIDSPSGIGPSFRLACSNADMAIIVTNGELPAMRDAQHAAGVAASLGIRDIRLMVNRVQTRNLRHINYTLDDVIDSVGVRLIGVIPEDSTIFRALHANTPLILYKKRYSAYDFLDVARRISGESIPLRQHKPLSLF